MRYGLGECLVKFDKKMNAVPWLADKWTISDDKLTFLSTSLSLFLHKLH